MGTNLLEAHNSCVYIFRLKTEAADSSVTLVPLYQNTRRYIPKVMKITAKWTSTHIYQSNNGRYKSVKILLSSCLLTQNAKVKIYFTTEVPWLSRTNQALWRINQWRENWRKKFKIRLDSGSYVEGGWYQCTDIFHSPVAGFSLLVFEVSWSHTTTRHSR
jgi:hypothetical protein